MASPFIGEWKLLNGDGMLRLNLYSKEIYEEGCDGGRHLCYGTICVACNNGASVDNCLIAKKGVNGNRAIIEFVGGRDGNTCRAALLYDHSAKHIIVKTPLCLHLPVMPASVMSPTYLHSRSSEPGFRAVANMMF